MTRQEAKELLPIIQAFTEGKSIQSKIEGLTGWINTDEIYFEYDGQKVIHRIKSEPKYRPFKNQEECWNEMLKHQPFGWVKSKHSKILYNIDIIDDTVYFNRGFSSYPVIFDNCDFVDGTPFGIKE